MGKDALTLLCKRYVENRDYEGALAIIDTIALVDNRKADAMYRFAFRRSLKSIAFDFIDSHSRLWVFIETTCRGKALLHRLAR